MMEKPLSRHGRAAEGKLLAPGLVFTKNGGVGVSSFHDCVIGPMLAAHVAERIELAKIVRNMKHLLSGEFTIRDGKLYDYMRDLLASEQIFLEPSACAAFEGPARMERDEQTQKYLLDNHLMGSMQNAVHIAWATGGNLVPEEIRTEYKNTYL